VPGRGSGGRQAVGWRRMEPAVYGAARDANTRATALGLSPRWTASTAVGVGARVPGRFQMVYS